MQDATGPMIDLPADLTSKEICAALGGEAIASGSPQGRVSRRTIARGQMHLILKELAQAVRQGFRGRRQGDVFDFYNKTDEVQAQTGELTPSKRKNFFRIGDDFLVSITTQDAFNFAMRRVTAVLSSLKPTAIAEIGSGTGRNLLYVASHLPNVPCAGFELTPNRVKAARQLQALDLPNTDYGRLYAIAAGGMDNVRRIKFETASAFDLPAADRSIDIVFTFAALEQMELGLDKALSEIRRVAGRYVLLYEPFADANGSLERAYLWSRNYFRMPSGRLRDHGLEPLKVWTGFPLKPTFGYALVLCRPAPIPA